VVFREELTDFVEYLEPESGFPRGVNRFCRASRVRKWLSERSYPVFSTNVLCLRELSESEMFM
jgi:hypothetical protein